MNLSAPSGLLAILVLLPLLAAALSLATASRPAWRRGVGWVLAVGQIGVCLMIVSVFDTPPPAGVSAGPLPIAQMSMSLGWLSGVDTPAQLGVDGINLYALLLLSVLVLLALLADSIEGDSRGALRQAGVFVVSGTSVGFLLSRDLVLAAACHGTAALVLAGVVHLGTGSRARRPAALSFLVPAMIGSALLWFAGVWTRAAGDGLSASIDALVMGATPSGAAVALVAFLILHLPLVPFHRWQTHSCGEGASKSGIVLVGGAWTILGVVGWLRLGMPLCTPILEDVCLVLTVWGMVSAAAAVMVAAVQRALDHRLRWVCLVMAGWISVGIGTMNLPSTSGALLLCAALGLPRAGALLFARWLPADRGGRQAGIWWSLLSVSMVALIGTGAFAGLLPLLFGGSVWPLWICVVLTTSALGVLLIPVPELSSRRDTDSVPAPLRLILILTVGVTIASGWRPAWLADWVRPDVERVLSAAPVSGWSPVDEMPAQTPEAEESE